MYCQLKKSTTWKLRVKFYLGEIRTYPLNSISGRDELGYIGVFATKGREQEQKRPGLTEIIPLICTSTIRASILSFHSLQDSPALTLGGDCIHRWLWHSLSLTTDWAEIPPKEEKGEYQDMIKVRGRCMQHTHILQKFVADLLKVTTSHKEQTSPWRILVFF